jgi:tetratricopeptide (TPR) repeat protein
MLETVFDEWVRQARVELQTGMEYPPIEDETIDMSDELAQSWISASADGGEGAAAFLLDRMIATGSFPVRFVVLNFLFRLMHYEGIEQEWAVQKTRAALADHFAKAVRFQDVSVLDDLRAIRWEIVNFCAIREWDRAAALYGRLKDLGATTSAEHRALVGQMHLWSVIAPRQKRDDPLEFLVWWAPELDQTWDLRSFELFYWGMELSDWGEYSEAEKEKVSDAAHCWELAFETILEVHGSYRTALAKCYFIRGDYLKAAQQYHRVLDQTSDPAGDFDLVVRSEAFANAAECYRRAGDTRTGTRFSEQRAHEFPRAKGVWMHLAVQYLSSPLDLDLQKVLECLRKEEEIDRAFGEDPRASIALALAELGRAGIPTALREFAESNPEICQVMDVLMSRHWAGFQSLDGDSRKQWVGAAAYLWGTSPLRSVLRRKVALMFPDIAESQLRRLFDRFRQEKGPTTLQGISSAPEKDKLVKFLKGSPLTLGEMIFEIEATRRLPEPAHPDLKSWLQRHARRLTQSWDTSRAWRLNDLRCHCHGGEISEQEAIELYDLSVWLVSQLAAN